MFKYGDHMMGIQGHPEYTKDILLHLIDRLLQRNFIVVCYVVSRAPFDFHFLILKPDMLMYIIITGLNCGGGKGKSGGTWAG